MPLNYGVTYLKLGYVATLNMLYALRTNVHVWKSESLAEIDSVVENAGFRLLDLPWETMHLRKHDQDHFTWAGFRVFCRALADALHSHGITRVSIYADSTIDHLNWSSSLWTGSANEYCQKTLARRGVDAYIDSVCGSGYVAGERFADRVMSATASEMDDVLIVGGWNDERYTVAKLKSACAQINKLSN